MAKSLFGPSVASGLAIGEAALAADLIMALRVRNPQTLQHCQFSQLGKADPGHPDRWPQRAQKVILPLCFHLFFPRVFKI